MASKSAKVSNARFDVEKFDGKINFGLWQVQVRDILIQQGLHKALKGVKGKPADMADEDWEEYDLQACSTIRLCLAKEITYNVMRENSAASLWAKLEGLYMTKSLTSRLYLKKKLYKLQMAEGMSLSDHLNEFNRLISELLNVGEEVEDEDKALLLLSSLPDSYEHLVTTLLYGKDTIELESVTAALLSNEMRKKTSDSDSQADGLFVRGRSEDRKSGKGRSKSRSKSRKKEIECYKCHEKGHIKRNCPLLQSKDKKGEVKGKSKGFVDEASVAELNSDDDDGNVLSVASQSYTQNAWILDSGCSYHMCPNREWFTSYEKVDGGTVLMGNNMACKTVGRGSIKIKMHDGVMRTLT